MHSMINSHPNIKGHVAFATGLSRLGAETCYAETLRLSIKGVADKLIRHILSDQSRLHDQAAQAFDLSALQLIDNHD